MKKLIIAIDGHAATGKSTQAKRLAKKLGYVYVDTGAMYRAITLFAYQQEPVGEIDYNLLQLSLDQIQIHFEGKADAQQIFLNGKEVTKAIRKPEINNLVSQVAAKEPIRFFLKKLQRELGANKGIVMDGRDIGTVVFPEAACKFFLTANATVRAQRRYEEQLAQGHEESFEAVLTNLKSRDALDETRSVAPLKKAADAVEIDVSNQTIEEVFELLYAQVLEKLAL